MNASEAFVAFISQALIPARRKRFAAIASTKKGRERILDGLSHDFEKAVRPDATRERKYQDLWAKPCFVFHSSLGFGAEFASVRGAYDKLATDDSWLILLQDGSAGIHRPEARWDDEILIVG